MCGLPRNESAVVQPEPRKEVTYSADERRFHVVELFNIIFHYMKAIPSKRHASLH